jgi:hypothetical protein
VPSSDPTRDVADSGLSSARKTVPPRGSRQKTVLSFISTSR